MSSDRGCELLLDEREIARYPFAWMQRHKVPETMPKFISNDQVAALLKVCEGPSFRQRQVERRGAR